MAHHALGTAIGTILSQTGDWFGERSKQQKENVDSSAMAVTVLLKLAVTVYSEDGKSSAVEMGNNTNLFDSS